MPFYVKVGDENTEIPECCDECYMCQDIYSSCDECLLIAKQIGDSYASNVTIPHKCYCAADCNRTLEDISKKPDWCPIIANGIILPENHGKIVDLGKIDEDRIEQDNPVITININGTAIEAVSLDYLDNLPDLTKKEELI